MCITGFQSKKKIRKKLGFHNSILLCSVEQIIRPPVGESGLNKAGKKRLKAVSVIAHYIDWLFYEFIRLFF